MRGKPKIGQYRHTPGTHVARGPDGAERPLRKRRRFPYVGMVPLATGLAGALVCAGVSSAFRSAGLTAYLPKTGANKPLPPAPSLQNVLFGLALPETILVCALVGWLLWRSLWNTRLPEDVQQRGPRVTLRFLLPNALLLGGVAGLLALPVGGLALFIRTAPDSIPWAVRPLFAIPAGVAYAASALLTVVPWVLIFLGLLLGAVLALSVALLWPHFPEEPVLR